MKEAISTYWITAIFITFIVLFTGYLCLSINMNKAYKVKNEIINIIQKNNGLDDQALGQIQNYMTKVGYRTTGQCSNDSQDIGYGMNGTTGDSSGLFCARPVWFGYENNLFGETQFPDSAYYSIKVFFSIDLPVVRRFFTFQIKGSTKRLFNPSMI